MYKTKRQKVTNHLQERFNYLIKEEKKIPVDKLVAITSIQLGIKEDFIMDVVKTFETAGKIEIEKGEIYPPSVDPKKIKKAEKEADKILKKTKKEK
ncbi:MAG: hypothetical protein ACOC56_01450 [Atribacterota bacterium]